MIHLEKIISILDLENNNTYTLYELDKNEEIQNKIMELIPETRNCVRLII
jgi:DNA-directed RNA polymerase subunit F